MSDSNNNGSDDAQSPPAGSPSPPQPPPSSPGVNASANVNVNNNNNNNINPTRGSTPYEMERTDTLATVVPQQTQMDHSISVQTDQQVLGQHSTSRDAIVDDSSGLEDGIGTDIDTGTGTGAIVKDEEEQQQPQPQEESNQELAVAPAVTAPVTTEGRNVNLMTDVPTPTVTSLAAAIATTTTAAPPVVTSSLSVQTSSRRVIKQRSKLGISNHTPTPMNNHSSKDGVLAAAAAAAALEQANAACLNPPSEVNARLDTQVEVKVYPCNNSTNDRKKKFTQFMVKPEGVIIQGTNKNRTANNDLGSEYSNFIGRKLQRYELSDTRACQLLVTSHAKSFWVVPAPEAFSRHSGTCRLLGDRKHPVANHTLQVGDFLRVGSVGVVVIETHNGEENRILSEEKIQKIMKDTTNSNGAFLDIGETDGENSDDSMSQSGSKKSVGDGESPVCYMCFDDENTEDNPLITPCKCRGDTRYVHVGCLRKWHTAEADNQICFLSSVDATCSVCKSTFKSDFKLKDGRLVKLFKSSLEPPYVSLLVATKHEMAQRLFNTRFQLSFSTLMKPDGRNATRALLLGRSSGSDMVLDYRTVSARHANIRFKNGEFIFTDASSSNGSYLYLRRPVELTPSQPVQFRLGRSMISMKVVNKWNRRLLRAVRRNGNSSNISGGGDCDDHSVGSNEQDVRITDGRSGTFTNYLPRRSRESIIDSMPGSGELLQTSAKHLDLLHALAYPKKSVDNKNNRRKDSVKKGTMEETKTEETADVTNLMASVAISDKPE